MTSDLRKTLMHELRNTKGNSIDFFRIGYLQRADGQWPVSANIDLPMTMIVPGKAGSTTWKLSV
jgi:hypothetical protein